MSVTKIFKTRTWLISWQFFYRAFIYLGLPLLAWGLDDLAGFFSNPIRASLAVVVTVQTLLNAWLIYRTPPPPEQNHRIEPHHWHFDIIEMIFFLAAFNDRRDLLTWNASWVVGAVGLGIYLIGSSLSIWANFTWVSHLWREGKRACASPVLLREGPFRWIRHPNLLCLIIYGPGFALMFRSWLGLILVIPLIGATLNRLKVLEQDYAEQYPKAWPERCRTSKRIIPFVY